MPIHFNCSVCEQRLKVPNFAAGRITKCTGCGNAMRVPQPTTMLQQDENDGARAKGKAPTAQLEELSVGDVWHRSLERLSGSLDWLADRPIRILFVALILVGCYVGVATAKWALRNPPTRQWHLSKRKTPSRGKGPD